MHDLPDVNVWLALALPHHPHHQRAARYWRDEASERVCFCTITALGFLRLCSNAHATGGKPLTVTASWRLYRAYRTMPEVDYRPENDGVEERLARWAEATGAAARMWTDAYLAAFAVSGGLRVVTFDRGFARFPGLDLLLLET